MDEVYGGGFPATRVSLVRATADADEGVRRRAFDRLLEGYWRPVYKHLRWKWRLDAAEAEDATQEFFLRALEKGTFARYAPDRARFRTFVRLCVDRFAANRHEAALRQKRGGGVAPRSLDFRGAESELALQPIAADADPETAFHREWMRGLFELALADLRTEAARSGKQVPLALFERYDLERTEAGPDYAALGREFGLPVTQVTNHLAWARRELRRFVLARLRELTTTDEEYRAEARVLLGG